MPGASQYESTGSGSGGGGAATSINLLSQVTNISNLSTVGALSAVSSINLLSSITQVGSLPVVTAQVASINTLSSITNVVAVSGAFSANVTSVNTVSTITQGALSAVTSVNFLSQVGNISTIASLSAVTSINALSSITNTVAVSGAFSANVTSINTVSTITQGALSAVTSVNFLSTIGSISGTVATSGAIASVNFISTLGGISNVVAASANFVSALGTLSSVAALSAVTSINFLSSIGSLSTQASLSAVTSINTLSTVTQIRALSAVTSLNFLSTLGTISNVIATSTVITDGANQLSIVGAQGVAANGINVYIDATQPAIQVSYGGGTFPVAVSNFNNSTNISATGDVATLVGTNATGFRSMALLSTLAATFSATLILEYTTDNGGSWISAPGSPIYDWKNGKWLSAILTPADGFYVLATPGVNGVRVRALSVVSGICTVNMVNTQQVDNLALQAAGGIGKSVPVIAGYVAGTDGTLLRGLKTDTAGQLVLSAVTSVANVSNLSTVGSIAALSAVTSINFLSTIGGISSTVAVSGALSANVTSINTVSTITQGALSAITSVNFLSTLGSISGTVATSGAIASVNFISTLGGISNVVATSGAIASINFLSTIGSLSTIASLSAVTSVNFLSTIGSISGTVATSGAIASINFLSSVAQISSVLSVAAVSTVAALSAVTSVNFLSTLGGISNLVATSLNAVSAVTSINTLSSVTQLSAVTSINLLSSVTQIATLSTITQGNLSSVASVGNLSTITSLPVTTVDTIFTRTLSGQFSPFSLSFSANALAMTLPLNTRSVLARVMGVAGSVAVTICFLGHQGQPSSTDPANFFYLPALQLKSNINVSLSSGGTPGASLYGFPWILQESIASGDNKLFYIANLANVQTFAIGDNEAASGTSVVTLSGVLTANNMEVDAPLFAGPLGFSSPPLAVQVAGTDGTNLRGIKTDTTGRLRNVHGNKATYGAAFSVLGGLSATGAFQIVNLWHSATVGTRMQLTRLNISQRAGAGGQQRLQVFRIVGGAGPPTGTSLAIQAMDPADVATSVTALFSITTSASLATTPLVQIDMPAALSVQNLDMLNPGGGGVITEGKPPLARASTAEGIALVQQVDTSLTTSTLFVINAIWTEE